MTPRDRAGGRSGRREAAGDNRGRDATTHRHRQGFSTHAGGPHARPERRPAKFGQRRARLAVPRNATARAPWRKPWQAVSMSHYQRSLVLWPTMG